MKIILSRKGYDDEYGGKPSVILPDGKMLSFPIPINNDKEKGINTESLSFGGFKLTKYFVELNHSKINMEHHVDPDIYGLTEEHKSGSFGQSGAALCHLRNQNVGKGDIFLFYGSFCKTHLKNDSLCYEKMHPVHALFGYLEIDEMVTIQDIDNRPDLAWLKKHPHYINREIGDYKNFNAIFVGKNFGYFNFHPILQLTKPGFKKSYWQMPVYFKDIVMTYNEHVEKRIINDFVEFSSAAKGQEFVFQSVPELNTWLENILSRAVSY